MLIVLVQRTGSKPVIEIPKIDTVIHEIEVHDTIVGKSKLIKIKGDTVWKDSIQYKADTSYAGLLKQYDSVVDKYFTEHIYKTDYKLGTYGTASVLDTIVANMIIGNSIAYNVTIPEKIVTIKEPAKLVKQVYVGGSIFGNSISPIKAVYIGTLYKDKKDRVFGLSVGYDGSGLVYGVSSYWKIKF
jgi:hypothetical protein